MKNSVEMEFLLRESRMGWDFVELRGSGSSKSIEIWIIAASIVSNGIAARTEIVISNKIFVSISEVYRILFFTNGEN
jgi:hypothetical protein